MAAENEFVNTSEGKCFPIFCNNVPKTSSHLLKISKNIEIEYLFHFKASFHIFKAYFHFFHFIEFA